MDPSYRRWLGVVSLAEFAGFAVPASVGATTATASPWIGTPALVAAGCLEGLLLGSGQAWCLRRTVPGFPSRGWIRATVAGAALAWCIGVLPALAYGWWSDWPVAALAPVAVVLGISLLLSIGTAQALSLPRHAAGKRAWVLTTAAGWAVGLGAFTAVTTPWWHPGQATWQVIGIGVVGGAVMAVAMAAVTGIGMLRWLSPAPAEPPDALVSPAQVREARL